VFNYRNKNNNNQEENNFLVYSAKSKPKEEFLVRFFFAKASIEAKIQ
jgi:hypothetical protein